MLCVLFIKILIERSVASDLGLHCLPMSHKKDVRLNNLYMATHKWGLGQTIKTQMKCH